MRLAPILISALWGLPTLAFPATVAATIAGRVVDGSGEPIAGASVIYKNVQAFKVASSGSRIPAGPLIAAAVKTGADGSFSIGGLAMGTYNLCAYGVSNTDLGSCEWGQGTTQVTLSAGQTISLNFQVAQGALLTFQVQDLTRKIVSLEDLPVIHGRLPLTGANFGIGIWAGSRYVRAALVSKTAITRQYEVAIPKTATVRLYLDTSLAVLDANAAAIPLRQVAATIRPAGQRALTINLSVP